MPLVTLNEVLPKAREEGYAVPGFNFYSYEDALQIITGAVELYSPVILMATGKCVKHLGLGLIPKMVEELVKDVDIPVVLHLDHASELETIYRAMKLGFTSVMYDGSLLPIEDNIKNTKKVVEVAHALGITVEAEIGRVGKGEDGEDVKEILTEPKAALEFYKATKIDALAIAVGTAHGMQKQTAKIHHDLIEKVSNIVEVPLVLHGSSGVKDEDIIRVSKTGISKINIGTRLRSAYTDSLKDYFISNPDTTDYVKAIEASSTVIKAIVKEKIMLMGSEKKGLPFSNH